MHRVGEIPESIDIRRESPLIEVSLFYTEENENSEGKSSSVIKMREVIGDVCRINEVLRSVLKSQIINMHPAPVAIIGRFG